MRPTSSLLGGLAMLLALVATPASGQLQSPVYGSEFMTTEEIAEYHQKRSRIEDPDALEAFDQEHYRRIRKRIRESGASLESWTGYSETREKPVDWGRYTTAIWKHMTPAEREHHTAYLRSLPRAEDRLAYLTKLYEFIEAKAKVEGRRIEPAAAEQPRVYGEMLMTPEEKSAYLGLMSILPEEERVQQEAAHYRLIQRRAREIGGGISDWAGTSRAGEHPWGEDEPGRMMYYWSLMSDEEQARHVEKLREMPDAQARIDYIQKQYERIKREREGGNQ